MCACSRAPFPCTSRNVRSSLEGCQIVVRNRGGVRKARRFSPSTSPRRASLRRRVSASGRLTEPGRAHCHRHLGSVGTATSPRAWRDGHARARQAARSRHARQDQPDPDRPAGASRGLAGAARSRAAVCGLSSGSRWGSRAPEDEPVSEAGTERVTGTGRQASSRPSTWTICSSAGRQIGTAGTRSSRGPLASPTGDPRRSSDETILCCGGPPARRWRRAAHPGRAVI